MALVLLPANANLSVQNGQDVAGAFLLTWFRALITSGYWRQKGAGDGVATFTTTTTDIFTAGLGYKVSGTWASVLANSCSNNRAWMCIEEVGAGGVATGRMLAWQRGTGTALGNDRFNIVAFSPTGWSGVPSATAMFPTGTYNSMYANNGDTFGTAGSSIVVGGVGTPYLGGATATTLTYSIWVPDSLSAAEVAPTLMTASYSSLSGGPINTQITAFLYESTKCQTADTRPYVVGGGPLQGAFGGPTLSSTVNSFGSTGQQIWTYTSPTVITTCSFSQFSMPDGSLRPANTTAVQANPGGNYPILPLAVNIDSATSSTFKGYCETLQLLLPGSASFLNGALFHTAVLDAVEPPRVSLGVVVAPWAVGQALASSLGNRTDVYTALPASVVDVTAPVINNVSPAPGAVSVTQAIVWHATDPGGTLVHVSATVDYTTPDRHDSAFSGLAVVGGYDGDYDAGSTVSAITDGYSYSLVPDGGWRGAFTLRITAIDAGGNVTTSTQAYTMSLSNAPALSSITPAPASVIPYTNSVAFRAADTRGLLTEIIYVAYPSGVRELVWNGSTFSSAYSGSSTRSVIVAGKTFDYLITRTLGWPADPTLEVKLIDVDGQVVDTSIAYTLTAVSVPTVGGVTPVSGSAIAYNDSVTLAVLDDVGLAEVVVRVQYPAPLNRTDVIYAGGALRPPYDVISTVVPTGNQALAFVFDDGWYGDPTILISAIDVDGNETHTSTNYTIAGFNPLAPDVSAPVISLVNPASLSVLATGDAVSFRVEDLGTLAFFSATVDYLNVDRHEVAYLSGFDSRYAVGSSLTPTADGYDVVIDRDLGWADAFSMKLYAIDEAGNDVSLTISYTLSETYLPTISNVLPVSGTGISQGASISFRARDATKLSVVSVLAKFPSVDLYEVVWDNSVFSSKYDAGSSQTPSVPNYVDFVIDRDEGWPAPLTLKILAVDEDNNLVVTDLDYTIQTTPVAPEATLASGSSWGLGEWGTSGWGSGDGGPLPLLLGVTPDVADVAGGTVVALLGSNFSDPMTVEVLQEGVVVGTGVISNPAHDLTATRVFAGLPALAAGFYDLRITTAGGQAFLSAAIEYRPFAAAFKVESVRSKWGRKWNLSTRIL